MVLICFASMQQIPVTHFLTMLPLTLVIFTVLATELRSRTSEIETGTFRSMAPGVTRVLLFEMKKVGLL